MCVLSSQQSSSIIARVCCWVACVDSLHNYPIKIEIIVADDASIDGSFGAFSRSVRVQTINGSVNIGFVEACNRGSGCCWIALIVP